jgi:hypothetical protein
VLALDKTDFLAENRYHGGDSYLEPEYNRVSWKIKSAVCLSVHLLFFSFWRENTTDFKSVDMLT